MAGHHVEAPEQVVTPGEELWVKIIDIDLERRRISLSIKQAAEGGVVAAEYQDQFGDHAYDEQGNYVGPPGDEPSAAAGEEATAAADTAGTLDTAAEADAPDIAAAAPASEATAVDVATDPEAGPAPQG
jgi:small subunit ribosomal protein S1